MRFSQSWLDSYNARQRVAGVPASHCDVQDVASAGGERQNAPRSVLEREADLHEAVFAECRRRRWLCFHGAMSERTHRTLGEPDFIICASDGRVFFVECKSRTGKLSPAQQATRHAASALGHTIHVVRSFEEFLEAVS